MSGTNSRPSLHHCGDLAAAVRSHRVVAVVQTREDAEAIAELGAVATAPLDGVWRDEYAEALTEAHVVVVPRNSPEGRRFAADAAVSLYGVAASAVVVEPPGLAPEAGLTEWVSGPGSARALMELRDRGAGTERGRAMAGAIRSTPGLDPEALAAFPLPVRRALRRYTSRRGRDVFALGGLAVLSGCAPNVVGRYGHSPYGPNLYLFVVAPAASEKGVLAHARALGEPIDQARRAQYQEELKAWKEEKKEDADTAGPKPRRRLLFISGDTSASALVRQLDANGGDGVMLESEADTLSQTLGKEYGTYSDVLRKAHAHEPVSLNRVEDEIHVGAPRLSLALSGTPNQLGRLIPSAEDGLFSRFVVYGFVQDDPLLWIDPRPAEKGDPDKALNRGAHEVHRVHEKLAGRTSPFVFSLTDSQWDSLSEWGAGKKRLLVGSFENAGAGVAHRAGLHAYRIAMLIGLWEAVESGVDIGSAESFGVSDRGFEAALSVMDVAADHSGAVMGALPKRDERRDPRDLVEWFDALPPEFWAEHAVNLAKKVGFEKRACYYRLDDLVSRGKLEKIARGHYRKV